MYAAALRRRGVFFYDLFYLSWREVLCVGYCVSADLCSIGSQPMLRRICYLKGPCLRHKSAHAKKTAVRNLRQPIHHFVKFSVGFWTDAACIFLYEGFLTNSIGTFNSTVAFFLLDAGIHLGPSLMFWTATLSASFPMP